MGESFLNSLREGRYAAAATAIFVVISLSTGMWPLLSGQSVIFEDDVVLYYLPAFKLYSESLAIGVVPLVAPIFSGFPLALTQVGGYLDPLNIPFFSLLPFLVAYHSRIFFNYLVAALFTYLFARSLRLSSIAATVAVFSYITAQHIVPEANILRSNSIFLMPILFYVIQKIFDSMEERAWYQCAAFLMLGITGIIISFLGGYTQLNLYSCIAAGMFVAFQFYKERSVTGIIAVAGMFVVAFLILTPYIFSTLQLASFSDRAGGLSWDAASSAVSAQAYLANITTYLFFPPFNQGTLQSLYIGTVSVFFLFGLSLVRKNSYAGFFAIVLMFSFLSAFPYPFFSMMHMLPVLEMLRFPPHWFFVTSFAMSMIASVGVHHLQVYGSRSKRDRVNAFLNKPGAHLLLLVLLTLNLVVPMRIAIAEQSISSQYFFEEPGIITAIKNIDPDSRGFRMHQLFPADMQWFQFAKIFSPDKVQQYDFNREFTQSHLTSLMWDVETSRGFDNLMTRRYRRVLEYLDKGGYAGAYRAPTDTKPYASMELPSGHFDILGMMNVKYILTLAPIEIASTSDVVPVAQGELNVGVASLYLYGNRRFVPRIYSPARITTLQEDENASFASIIESPTDFKQIGYIECNECIHESRPQEPVRITKVHESSPTRIVFETDARDAAWVVVSNAHIPGWHASIDGERTNLYYANYLYQGILIPQGNHTITIEYASPYSFH